MTNPLKPQKQTPSQIYQISEVETQASFEKVSKNVSDI